jgi:FtsP/CotA-like multicopper oxidase with cupredoxin domain
MRRLFLRFRTAFAALFVLAIFPCCALAGSSDPCPRPKQGSEITSPPDLYSQNGVLSVALNYYTTVDNWGRTLFCYETPGGLEAPTLHVNPGDTLEIQFSNKELQPDGNRLNAPGAVLSLQSLGSGVETVSGVENTCGDRNMSVLSANMHFHGLNVSPKCHSDEVIHTLVNPKHTFDYKIKIPKNEPPGMYWYHAHVHGIASPAVQGGASGAIEVEGIANLQPAVAGLPQRFLVFRDQRLIYPPPNGVETVTNQPVPFWDVSFNYVPISYPKYIPGIIKMQAGAQEFWRFVNASANTVADIVLLFDNKPQPLQIVALDGVPTGSHDGRHQGTIITQKDIFIPPAGRAEFIVTGPSSSVKKAVLMTEKIDTGPGGDSDTQRPLAQIKLTSDIRKIPKAILPIAGNVQGDRFDGLDDSMVTAYRRLYFSEVIKAGKKSPWGGSLFFITVEGGYMKLYNPDNPPAVTTYPGAVEDWTIENHSHEVHEFHIHQIHFQVIAIDGKPVPPEKRQFRDTYQVHYWNGVSKQFPSVTLRMDFRGAVEGEFVYHCHILDHEDAGMMANILVTRTLLPPKGGGFSVPTHQTNAATGKVKKASAGGATTHA